MRRRKKKKPVVPGIRNETDPPTSEYLWVNQQNSIRPAKGDRVPSSLEGLSQLDAIAWVHANCKFAKKS